jgi:hypothetical protein
MPFSGLVLTACQSIPFYPKETRYPIRTTIVLHSSYAEHHSVLLFSACILHLLIRWYDFVLQGKANTADKISFYATTVVLQ